MCRPGRQRNQLHRKIDGLANHLPQNFFGHFRTRERLHHAKTHFCKWKRRNSSSSSGERRAISTGMYSPPSGARPRNTAPRSDVSGACLDVLRYLTRNSPSYASCIWPNGSRDGPRPAPTKPTRVHRASFCRIFSRNALASLDTSSPCLEHGSRTWPATQPPARCSAPALRNSAGVRRSVRDSSGRQFRAASRLSSAETRRATIPASDPFRYRSIKSCCSSAEAAKYTTVICRRRRISTLLPV